MRDIAREIQIDAKVRAVLTGESGPATDLHRLLLAYEKGDWLTVAALATLFGVQGSDVAKAYGESLIWYNRFLAVDV